MRTDRELVNACLDERTRANPDIAEGLADMRARTDDGMVEAEERGRGENYGRYWTQQENAARDRQAEAASDAHEAMLAWMSDHAAALEEAAAIKADMAGAL